MKDSPNNAESNLNTGIKTVIVETHEDSKKSLQARLSDDRITFVDSLESASELLMADHGIKHVLFGLTSYKDKDFSQDADKKILLDSVWNGRDILDVIGNAIENGTAIGILIENPDAAFTKLFDKFKSRGADIFTCKKIPVTVKVDDLKTIVTDQFDGVGTGDVDSEEKEKMLADGRLVSVTNWPDVISKITSFVTKQSNTTADSKYETDSCESHRSNK